MLLDPQPLRAFLQSEDFRKQSPKPTQTPSKVQAAMDRSIEARMARSACTACPESLEVLPAAVGFLSVTSKHGSWSQLVPTKCRHDALASPRSATPEVRLEIHVVVDSWAAANNRLDMRARSQPCLDGTGWKAPWLNNSVFLLDS